LSSSIVGGVYLRHYNSGSLRGYPIATIVFVNVAGATFVVSIVNADVAPATLAVATAKDKERDVWLPKSIVDADIAGACSALTIVFGPCRS
jgi:hypothetical protein